MTRLRSKNRLSEGLLRPDWRLMNTPSHDGRISLAM